MLTLHTKLDATDARAQTIAGELELPYELREKSRLRASLRSGEDVAIFTVRGTVLRDGDLYCGSVEGSEADQGVIRIVAAPEATYRVDCPDHASLLRCAFHLGNRHTQAQVGGSGSAPFLRIRRDPVLRDMLAGLGANVVEELAPFEPESGAYGGHGGHGGHGHHHGDNLLAPIPLRQKIHRPSDPKE